MTILVYYGIILVKLMDGAKTSPADNGKQSRKGVKGVKELIARDDYGVFADGNATARVDSLVVARVFGKSHDKVIRDIQNLDCSAEFNAANFGDITYKDSRGRKQKAISMTRDGFTFLVMGYRGKKAAQFKEAYIKRFNEMEALIKTRLSQKEDFRILTEHIALIHDEPKAYHFSNECDMINRLVTGMSAKRFREAHGIAKGESVRPYLTPDEARMMDDLQRVDVGFLLAIPDFQERKAALTAYRDRRKALTP